MSNQIIFSEEEYCVILSLGITPWNLVTFGNLKLSNESTDELDSFLSFIYKMCGTTIFKFILIAVDILILILIILVLKDNLEERKKK